MAHSYQDVRSTYVAPNRVHVESTVHKDIVDRTTYDVSRTHQFVYSALDILEVLLLFRFALKLFRANPASDFAAFIYAVTAPLMAPFTNLFPSAVRRGFVFEWSALVAMAVYALLVYGALRLIRVSANRENPPTADPVD